MSDNLELSVSISTEEPEVAATLSDLRYLVFQGMKGDTGDSAYEEAVSLGFVGTEAEWIASLKGEKGDTGFSPEITSSAIPGGHRIDIYNELGPDSFNVMDGEDGTDGVSPTVQTEAITGGHRVTITDATHPQGQSFNVMDGDPGDDYVLTPQDKAEIAGMVPVPTVPTEDISANTAARHTHENKAVLDGITAAKVQSWDGKGTYSKPSGGIPASDLASGVIPSVPQMATQADMSDWTSGKTVDAATLKADYMTMVLVIDDLSVNKANKSELPDASTSAPVMDGTAAVGTSADYARADHVHPSDTTRLSTTGNAYRSASIPMGHLDSTSTATVMTATVDGITELRDGVCMWLRNGVITSASGFTLNVNGLGAKPCYSSLAAASRSTTIFNVNYTMLLIYNSTRVEGGCWDIVYGIDTNTTYTPPKLGFGYAVCSTAAATAAKTASISSYALTAGGIVSIKFDNDVPANATLNITSKGAKAIYHRGAAITANVIKAGDTATFVYSTYYHLIAIDRDEAGDALPAVTASDNGKVLGVVNGAWAVKSDEGGSSVTVDDALSTTSENPVQNKVVKAALDQKANASSIQQNVRLDVVQMTTSDIQPLFVDVLAGNWLGSQNAAFSNSGENAEKYFTFSGTSGSNTVSVTGGTASISGLTANKWWRGVVEYDDGRCVPTMVDYQGVADTLSIYPPLDSAVTSGKIMPMMFSIHATSLGYKWYSQFVYSQNAKHCVKSKPIARYRAWNEDTNPLTKINSFWWGNTSGNVQRNLQCTNNTLKFLYMNIGTGASAATPKGYSWTVNTGGKIGYAEICLSGTDGVSFFEYPAGEGIFVELYEDGTLAQSYHKTTVHFERVCLDFSECDNVMVKVYVTGNSVNHSMNLMEISFWETGNYRTELLPFGSIPAQMFDSWGVQFDSATATEFKRLHSAKLGVTAPWENHSLGGATSAWGRAWFYENVVKYHPTHMLIDFIINDSNSRGVPSFAQTVAGPDGTLYDNVMDTVDEYIANMNAIIRMAIAAGIQPIICMAPYAENEKPDWSVKLIDAWASQGA